MGRQRERDQTALVASNPSFRLRQSRSLLPAASLSPTKTAKIAIARRAKPGAPPGHVRLILTLELRLALAE
jgi:hypothetical protein